MPTAAAKPSKPAKQAFSFPGAGDFCDRTVAVAKQRTAMDSSAKAAAQSSQAAGEPAAGSTCDQDSGGHSTPRAMAGANAVTEHMQRDLQGIQHGIAGIAVNGESTCQSNSLSLDMPMRCEVEPACTDVSASAGDVAGDVASDEEGVAQPSTPSRQEDSSPIAGKAHLLGTRRDSEQEDAAYAKLYEETNMLLKGLHFARLQRTTGS